ncbi:MAG: O-antigen ligase family protein [Opitutus sp.]
MSLLLALTLGHPSATRIHTWPWALLAAIYWMAPVVLAITATFSGVRSGWPNRALPIGLGLLVAAAVGSAMVSPFPAASLARIWPTLGGAALYWLLHRQLSEPNRADRTIRLARGMSVIGAAVILVSASGWSGGDWPLPWGARNTVPFGHSIYTAGFTVLALPWLACAAWRGRGAVRMAWGAIFAVALIVLSSTGSRGGALAFGAAATAIAGLIMLRTRWPTGRKAAIAVALVVVAGAAILADPRLRTLVMERSWSDAAGESNRQRSAMLAAGMKLGLERPWLGWGPGTVPLAYPRVRARLDGGVDNVLELHNTPLQIWATLGLAGGVAVALLLVGTLHAAGRRLLGTGASHVESLAAAASLGGYAIFALTDHQWDLPIISAFAAASLAILSHSSTEQSNPRHSAVRRRALIVGLSSGLAVLAIPLLRDLHARRVYEVALQAWEEGRVSDWIDGLDRAASLAPGDPWYQHQAAGALMEIRNAEPEPTRRAELTLAVIKRLEISLRTGVHQEFARFNLGWLNLDIGQPDAAAAHFVATAQLVPDKGGVYFGLGLALHAAGRRDYAIRAFALEWVNDPLSMSSPAWEIPDLATLRSAVEFETLRIYGELRPRHPPAAIAEAWARWWLAGQADRNSLARGFSAGARGFAAELPGIAAGAPVGGGTAWTRIYGAWREPEEIPGFLRAAGGDAAFAAALQHRARRHRGSFHAFLTAATEDDPALLRTYRRQRTGYGVLALHPDGPLLSDAYIVQENRVPTDFAAQLLPPKGWLPGRYFLELLPEASDPKGPAQ